MPLKALIFDVDGTLAETEEAHREAFNATFAAHGLDWHWSVDDYRVLLEVTGGKERIAAFQSRLPPAVRLDSDRIAEMHRDKTARYADILRSGGLALRPGVAALIDAARRAGLRLAVATTTNAPNVEALAHCCWGRPASDIFHVIAAGDMVSAKKPAPDIYHLALARLQLTAADALAFEDSLNGVRSAQAAGLKVVATPGRYTSHQDLSSADWLRDDLQGFQLDASLFNGS